MNETWLNYETHEFNLQSMGWVATGKSAPKKEKRFLRPENL